MANTPEGKVKDKVGKLLRKHGCYYHMPVTGGWGRSALDYIGCHNGLFFSIETKAPGKIPTDRQEQIIAEVERAQGRVFVIDGQAGLEELERWLSSTHPLD